MSLGLGAHGWVLPCVWVPSPWASVSPLGAKMADLKSILDAVARTQAFTMSQVTTRQDSLGTGKVTKVREKRPTHSQRLGD